MRMKLSDSKGDYSYMFLLQGDSGFCCAFVLQCSITYSKTVMYTVGA